MKPLIRAAAKYWEMSEAEFMSARDQTTIRRRQIVMWMAAKDFAYDDSYIAKWMNRKRAAITKGIKKIEHEFDLYWGTRYQIACIRDTRDGIREKLMEDDNAE